MSNAAFLAGYLGAHGLAFGQFGVVAGGGGGGGGGALGRSFAVQSRSSQEVFGNTTTRIRWGTGGDIEGDTFGERLIGIAAGVGTLSCRVESNTISAGTLTLQMEKNGVASGSIITIDSTSGLGEVFGVGDDVDYIATDSIAIKVVGSGMTGTAGIIMFGSVITPVTATETLTPMLCNSSGSNNLTSNSTRWYQKPAGNRTPQSDESDAEMEVPIAGTLNSLYLMTGTISRSTDCFGGIRIGNVDGNQQVTYDGSNDQETISDTVNTDTITARQRMSFTIDNGTGGGANNIESLGVALVNPDGDFFNVNGDDYRVDQQDGLTVYYPIGGSLLNLGQTVEADAEYTVPFDTTFKEIFMRIVQDVMSGDTTLNLRKNGVTVASLVVAGSSVGYYYGTTDVAVLAGDTVCFQMVTGAGTRVRFSVLGAVSTEA